ncbi:MAG: PHP domain-containing protein [Desulfopila sp.]|jgi:predicted metal-dependent phosphoesterase TrpH|nr:PHP domain-containing protein [Desulfopila sp.]
MSIDLHIHSNFSDGTDSPTELVYLALKRGLKALAITDHDTIAGVPECLAATAAHGGIEAISGIEVSVVHREKNFHLLGYMFDHDDPNLHNKVTVLQEARKDRNEKIIIKLQKLGIHISIEDMNEASPVGQTGRPHIAGLLCRKGIVKNMEEAFSKYLKKGAVAYESRFVYSAVEAIDFIKKSGGMAVLAHPAQVTQSFVEMSQIVGDLVDIGLDGIEGYYPTHSVAVRKKLLKIAQRYDMIVTGGSDYHGSIRPGTDMAGGKNVFVPFEALLQMKNRWKNQYRAVG